jgi:hypothetical protein
MAIKLKKDNVEEIKPFDYGSINKRDKQVVEEVIKKLNLIGSLQEEMIQKEFNIKPIPEVPYDKSIFYNICRELGIFIGYQGSVREGDLKYPIFSICADCRELDKLVLHIAKKYEKSDT